MKKFLLIASILFLGINSINSQEVGLRFGDVTGGNVGVDFVLPMGETTRIHGDISFGDGAGIDLIWDFIYRPLDGDFLYWYAGLGPYTFLGSPFELGAVGELGLEYRFENTPIVIGADWRPFFRLIDNTTLAFSSFGVNVRWRF